MTYITPSIACVDDENISTLMTNVKSKLYVLKGLIKISFEP